MTIIDKILNSDKDTTPDYPIKKPLPMTERDMYYDTKLQEVIRNEVYPPSPKHRG